MALGRARTVLARLPKALRRTLARLRVPRTAIPRPPGLHDRLSALLHGRSARVLAVVLVGLAGGIIGLTLGGRAQTPIGPADIALSLRPSWTGGTTVELPPLGALHIDSHWAPVRLNAQLAELHPAPAQRLIEDPAELEKLTEEIGGEVQHGVIVMLARGAACALLLGFLVGLVVFRSWRRALLSTGSAGAGLLTVGLVAYLTFSPQSVAEPRYTGLLANAPQVVGDARSIVQRFDAYRAQLAKLVGNVSRLYAATSDLPTYEPDPTTLRILHVSDIHLNPAAWNVIRSVSAQFQADLIVDTGDLTDHGSKPEDKFVAEIRKLKVPYVFIRGNHDSPRTEQAVAKNENAVVLNNSSREVEGLQIYGIADSRFTPDKSTRDDHVGSDQLRTRGSALAQRLRAAGTTPDLVLAHDPAEAAAFSGVAPLVLAGHAHQRSTSLLSTSTRLFTQGSTGGAGLRGLEGEQPTPIELSVLYFSRATHRLQGWDDLRLGGLGLTSAQIERHLEPDPDRTINPPAPPSPTTPPPTGSGSPPTRAPQTPSTSPRRG